MSKRESLVNYAMQLRLLDTFVSQRRLKRFEVVGRPRFAMPFEGLTLSTLDE